MNPQLKRTGEPAAAGHRFRVGQRVRMQPDTMRLLPPDVRETMAAHEFEIMRALPRESAVFQYHVKNAVTGQQRLVDETDLVAVS